MAVRRFDGVDDEIRCSIGAVNVTGAVTMVALARLEDNALETLVVLHPASGGTSGYDLFVSGKKLRFWTGSEEDASGFNVEAGEGWVLLAVTKPAGSAVPRFHRYVFASDTWTHENSGGTLGNGKDCAGGTVRFGAYNGAQERLKGDLAQTAVAKSALSDEQIEALVEVDGLDEWAGMAGLWKFGQASVEEAVSDLTGGGANQTAITGTTVLEEDPPIPYEPPPEGVSRRVAVAREFPPDTLAVRIADPQTGASIARWAEDEYKAQNILSGITKGGEMPGGHKESGGALPRDPRVDWPDTDTYLDYYLEGAGGEVVWSGRLNQAPESDGDRMVVEPKAVGHQAALDDRLGLRLGFIDGDLSKWGEPSAQRRADILTGAKLDGLQDVGWQKNGENPPGISQTLETIDGGVNRAVEAWLDSGGVPLGALKFDRTKRGTAFSSETAWTSRAGLVARDDDSSVSGDVTDYKAQNVSNQTISATTASRLFARLYFQRNSQSGTASEGGSYNSTWEYVKVLSYLAAQNLSLQGTWPNVGYTAKQMLELAVPLYSYLEAREEDLEDGGYVITQAWYSDPGPLSTVVKDLTRFELLDWFIMHGKRFELRFPGTYGRNWQANAGASELKETAEDGERAWDRLIVRYQDVDGSTRTVGWPGSGADTESAQLLITDPDHPAVKVGYPREDILDLKGISTPQRALEAGERWLQEANELSHAGTATLRGYIQDDKAVFRPVSQVQPGDWVRFNDSGSSGTGYRKIVAVSYDHDSRSASVTLDAPPQAVQALLERYGAALLPLGL